jgi:plasmid stabilization system protein ParE
MHAAYELIYLPRAHLDIGEIIDYMLYELKAPEAASRFADSLDEKVGILATAPYIGAVYKETRALEYEYRRIFVGNYTVFYIVLEDAVEIHRVIYSARNMAELI